MNHQEFSSKGGLSRATKLTKQRLTEIARLAASARWKRTALTCSASETPNPIPTRKIITEPVNRCQSPYCGKEGRQVFVQGMKAWLCEAHG